MPTPEATTRFESRRQPDPFVNQGVTSCSNVFSSIPHRIDVQINPIQRRSVSPSLPQSTVSFSPSLSQSTIPISVTDELQAGGSPLNSMTVTNIPIKGTIFQPSFSTNSLVPLCSSTGEPQGGGSPLKSMTDANLSMGNIYQPSISTSLAVPSGLVENSVSDPNLFISSTLPAVACNPEELDLGHTPNMQTQQFISLQDGMPSLNTPMAVATGGQFAAPDMDSVPETVITFEERFEPPASYLESASLFSDGDGPVHAEMAINSTPDSPDKSLTQQWHITSFLADPTFNDPVALSMAAQGAVPSMRAMAENWKRELQDYHDQATAHWFVHGLIHGFLLGSSLPPSPDSIRATKLSGTPRNNASAMQNQEVIDKSIAEELEAGRNLGPFAECPVFADDAFINPLGAAFKRIPDPPFRKPRRTTDMTQSGVNSTIRHETARVQYITFQQICDRLNSLPLDGTGRAFILDIKSAFRNLPIAPQDIHKQVFFWKGFFYVDLRLAFGAATGPALWSIAADLLIFVVRKRCHCQFLVLIDDNLGTGNTEADADEGFAAFISTATDLGVPVAENKSVQSATAVVYVGFYWDTIRRLVSLPVEKWERLRAETDFVLKAHSVPFNTLESLVGFLAFCSQVTPFGFLYIRHCYSLLAAILHSKSKPRSRRSLSNMFVTVPAKAKMELRWWHSLAISSGPSNVASVLPFTYRANPTFSHPTILCATDSSPTGYGGHWKQNYFSEQWPPHLRVNKQAISSLSTGLTEISAVYLALCNFGDQWRSQSVSILCDNATAVLAYSKRSSSSARISATLRDIVQLSLSLDVSLSLVWIPSEANVIADFLSRIQNCESLSHQEQELLERFQLLSRYRTPAVKTRNLLFF